MQSDNWVKRAKDEGYRSRAVFKLQEILKKTKLKKNIKCFRSWICTRRMVTINYQKLSKLKSVRNRYTRYEEN